MIAITYNFEQEYIWTQSIHNAFVLGLHICKMGKYNSINLVNGCEDYGIYLIKTIFFNLNK